MIQKVTFDVFRIFLHKEREVMLFQEGMNLNIQRFTLGLKFQPQKHSLSSQPREISSQIFCFLLTKLPSVLTGILTNKFEPL